MRSSTISILAAACISAVFGCGEELPDDDDAQAQVQSAALLVDHDPGKVTRADGGFACAAVPCPSNAPWDFDSCRCKPRPPAPDGGLCMPEFCPSGTKFSFDSCSCAVRTDGASKAGVSVTRTDDPAPPRAAGPSVTRAGDIAVTRAGDVSVTRAGDTPVTPDAGTCDPIPCPPMAPFDPVTCSCQGIVAPDPSDDPGEDVREVEPEAGCGLSHAHETPRERRSS